MRSNYKQLGSYIRPVDIRNRNEEDLPLLGVSVQKVFIPSIANTVGTDFSKYKKVKFNQFTYIPDTSRRGDKIGIAMLSEYDEALVSQAYTVFEIIDHSLLDPSYLMMWFSRLEFDRYARFKSHGSVREIFDWQELCETELPIPSIEKQREIVREYSTIVNRIALNEQLIQKLEETAQAIYRRWFVEFEFPDENGKPYKSFGGKMVWCEELEKEIPEGWGIDCLGKIAKITMGQSPSGESYNIEGKGDVFYQGRTDFGYRFPKVRMFTTEPKRRACKGDVLMSVRAPVGDLNISIENCCIGRGLASIRHNQNCQSFLYYLMLDVRGQFDIANDEGTIFGSITKDGLHDIQVLSPELELVKFFNSLVSRIDKMILMTCIELEKLIEMKELMLSKLTKVEESTEKESNV